MFPIVATLALALRPINVVSRAPVLARPACHNELAAPQPSRRAALVLFAAVLATSPASGRQWVASAMVDGIPLYAPSAGTIGSSGLPDEGFETLLPKVEGLATNAAAALEAANVGDWDRVRDALSAATPADQTTNLGKFAAILGDDAYTALGLKREYQAAAAALGSAAAHAAAGDAKEAERAVKAAELMDLSIQELLDLVPAPVVTQVRAREKALAKAIAREKEKEMKDKERERKDREAEEAMLKMKQSDSDKEMDQMGS